MFSQVLVLHLLSLTFLACKPSAAADTESLSTTSKPYRFSEVEQIILKSYPCPKECHCHLFLNPIIIGVFCEVNALDKNEYFSELNKTLYLSYMVIDCDPNDPKESALSDGIFKSLHFFISIRINNCQIGYISERAFSGMRSLWGITIQGGTISHFAEKSLQLPELFMLGMVSITETALSTAPSLCNLERLLYVNFSRNSLRSFKDTGMICSNPGNIETIDVSDNSIEYLPTNLKSVTSKLKYLVCNGNKIRKINAELFQNLTDIETLNMKENHLTELPLAFLDNNPNMQVLKLAYNKIETLPLGVFSNLYNMSLLNLDGMGLNNDVWLELKNLTTLEFLFMSNNDLTSFDNKTMSKLMELHRLEISGNLFQQIPNGTFAFQGKLGFLNMSGNSIERIEKASFHGLSSLENLYLQFNQIKTVHSDALSQLLELQILNISHNHLETIPSFPTFLRILDLRCNYIIDFDSSTFLGMHMLQGLSLMSNRLTFLPDDAFRTNVNLSILNLASNNISSFDNQIFPEQSKLKSLVLHNNSISTIPSFTNKMFQNLRVIDISENKLVTLAAKKSEALFPDSIHALDLSGNQIHFIQNDVIKLPYIRYIDLRRNRISTLSRETLQVAHLDSMPVNFYFAGNPFTCDCNLDWLKDVSHIQNKVYINTYIIRDIDSLYCEKVYRHEPGLMKLLPMSQFLCTYRMHCLDTCECCSNAECVCRRYCPQNCTCYQNYKQEVDIVDCLGSKLQSVPQVISANCTILDLSGNNFTTVVSGTFKRLLYLKELYLNYSQIHELKKGAFAGLYILSILNLGYNFLHYLDSALFKDLHKLLHLTISYNKIRWIEEKSFDLLTNLQYLDISGNELKTISRHEFTSMSKVTSLRLSNNPWSCDCQYLEMMNNFTLAHAKHIVDLNNVVCEKFENSSNNDSEIYSLSDLHLPDFCVNKTQNDPISSIFGKTAFAALGTVLFIFILSLVAFGIGFKHRQFLQVWCFVKFGWKFNQPVNQDEMNRSYDAFVSYSGYDETFIIRELVPYLEEPKINRKGFILCLHHRDFPVGAPIAETIISAVQNSKRTIIVLSDNFLKSEWCQYEFQTAHHQLLQEKKNRIIMILLHDINTDLLDEELKLYLKTCTYVKYGDKWLWPKLEYAMPKQNQTNAQDLSANFTDTEKTNESQQFEMTQFDSQLGDKKELIA